MDAKRTFELPDGVNRFIDDQVESGRHPDASDVVREALRRYASELEEDAAFRAALRSMVEDGRADIARGDYAHLQSPEEVSRYIGRLSDDAARLVASERPRRRAR